jgi:hypothetical protein
VNAHRLMSVRADLVKETLVQTICDRVRERSAGEPPLPALLDGEPDLARMGYLARLVEAELFEPARSPMPGLADMLEERLAGGPNLPAAVEAVARDLASREPLDRPEPSDADAVTWRVPGPGGHVRHYVALRLAAGRTQLKREFVFGFVIRCCEEALSPR